MITDFIIPPGLFLILAGLLVLFLKDHWRNAMLVFAPFVTLLAVWAVPDGNALTLQYLTYDLVIVRADALSRLFATTFAIMAFAGGIYAMRQQNTGELAAAFIYAGSAIGVIFAGDLLTVFVFWEIMAIASSMVVWFGGEGARKAGLRYAVIHFFGGVLLMAGVAGEVATTGSIAFDVMEANSWPRWLILAGFLVNAGAPPLSAWLPDAYPSASWSGSVFLSAFTTKTAIYVLMRTFPGEELLIYVGLFMLFYAIIYSILENDMRRVLSYAIINQVGLMVIGVGIGTEMALNGVAAHAFVHITYKALLLMAAGVVLYQTGKSKMTDLGGLFRSMPVTTALAAIGGLSTAAFPLTAGFVSKSMVAQAAADEKLALVWFSLAAASAGIFLFTTLKFLWFVFFGKDCGERPADAPMSMRVGMTIMAGLCIVVGAFPRLLYDLLPYATDYEAYTDAHIVAQFQMLLFSGLIFFLLLRYIKAAQTITLDWDWFYRGVGGQLLAAYKLLSASLWDWVAITSTKLSKSAARFIYRLHGPDGIFSETWSTGLMAFWTTVLLGLYLLVYLIN